MKPIILHQFPTISKFAKGRPYSLLGVLPYMYMYM